MQRPTVDVAVVMRNEAEHLPALIGGLRAQDYPLGRIHFVFADNGSTDGSADLAENLLAGLNAIVLRLKRNVGFTGGYLRALERCHSEMLALINADTKPEPNWLGALVDRMQSDPGIGICESRQMPLELDKPYDPETGETSWCSGGGMLIRRKALDEVGFFDPIFFIYFEDVDLCWRMWLNGWKCVYVPQSAYHHYGPAEQRDPTALPPARRLQYIRNRWYMSMIYGSAYDILHSAAALLSPTRLAGSPEIAAGTLSAFANMFHLLQRRRLIGRKRSPYVSLSRMSVGVKNTQ
ncbi:MAG: glycosyltransferase family 2 protein [Planctomycetes bacterium]|nr:glycosyltransferase family 2 protein [Planctomycetota bacterium]